MLSFAHKIFDSFVAGTQAVYTDTALSEVLGSVDHLTLYGAVDGTTASATIAVQVEQSSDGHRWMNRNTAAEFSWTSGGGNVALGPVSSGSATNKLLPRVRVRIQLGGPSPSGVVRLWAVGRDPAR